MKIAFIVPHLSTGGMPQYLNNKIEKLKDICEIWIFEKSHESTYNTIRLRIENQIGRERIVTWGNNPIENLLNILNRLQPDIVHFEEPCEQFLSDYLLENIFRSDRSYKIFETLHDSSIEIEEKRFIPDKFLVVSPWQVFLLQNLGVPIEVIEHQLPSKEFRDREKSLKLLGLDSETKHVLQVGIFTPRKNQRETVELARSFPNVKFHFVGTLAENYKFYWEPILENLPPNCVIWRERNDVDLFYQAADVVILPSLPLFNDKETSPLVIKEAVSWGTPLLLRNLSVYLDMFQESEKIKFMGQTIKETVEILSSMLDSEYKLVEYDLFEFKFSEVENKINFIYRGHIPLGKIFFSVKDRDSNACIFSFDAEMNSYGTDYWCIPIPKSYYDFSGNPNFSGFKIEAYYKKEDENPFFVGFINLKSQIQKKVLPSFPLINFEPVFVNYSQFFVDWIYNGFFAGARIKKAIDIGGSVGLFSQWVLDRFGNDTEILAVEPNTLAAETFRIFHLGNPTVKLEQMAVSDKSGLSLEMKIDPKNSLISSFEGTEESYTDSEKVETITLLDLIKKHNFVDCDLLKVDVEGAEYQIFEAVTQDDLRKFKYLLIEFHNNRGRARPLINKIRESGFAVDIRDDDTRFLASEESDRGTIFATRID